MNANALVDMVNAMSLELRDVPPGPERDARLRTMAEQRLKGAKSSQERIFWEAFLERLSADPAEEVLTFEQADALRTALSAAHWTQDFDEMSASRNETWFSPDHEIASRVLFFSKRATGIVLSYSDAKVSRMLSFREAMALAQEGKAL